MYRKIVSKLLSRSLPDSVIPLKVKVNQRAMKSLSPVALSLVHWWGIQHGFSSISHPGLNTGPLAPYGMKDCWISVDSGRSKRQVIPPLTYSEMRSRHKQVCISQETFLRKTPHAFLVGLVTAQNCFAIRMFAYSFWLHSSSGNMQAASLPTEKGRLHAITGLLSDQNGKVQQINPVPKHFLEKALLEQGSILRGLSCCLYYKVIGWLIENDLHSKTAPLPFCCFVLMPWVS